MGEIFITSGIGIGKTAYSDSISEAIRESMTTSNAIIEGFKKGLEKPTLSIKKVIFNDPATIILWIDGTKTVVKADPSEIYDPEKGMAMAIAKRALGDKGNYYNTFEKWLPEEKSGGLSIEVKFDGLKNLHKKLSVATEKMAKLSEEIRNSDFYKITEE